MHAQTMPLVLSPWFVWLLMPIGFWLLWRGVAIMRTHAICQVSWRDKALLFLMGLCEFAAGAGATWIGAAYSLKVWWL